MRQGLISFQNKIECIHVTVKQAKGKNNLMQALLSGKELC